MQMMFLQLRRRAKKEERKRKGKSIVVHRSNCREGSKNLNTHSRESMKEGGSPLCVSSSTLTAWNHVFSSLM